MNEQLEYRMSICNDIINSNTLSFNIHCNNIIITNNLCMSISKYQLQYLM